MPSGSLRLVLSAALVFASSPAFAQAPPEPAPAPAPAPAATAGSAPVKITTSDGKGLIQVDDKLVGEGSYVAELPAGVHKLKVTREGYDPFEEEFTVKDK